MKIRPVGAEFVPCGRTGRQTDTTKLITAFRNFANAPKNGEAGTMQKEQELMDYALWLIMVNWTTKQKKKPSLFECPLDWYTLDRRVFPLFSISRKFVEWMYLGLFLRQRSTLNETFGIERQYQKDFE